MQHIARHGDQGSGMEHLGRIIGENVKRLRAEAGLSLDGLARLSGVSKSRLGQIERGEANPSVTTLWQIANALKTEFSVLVTSPQAATVVVDVNGAEPVSSADGRYRTYTFFPFDPALGFEVFRGELDPGADLCAVPHAGASSETVVVVSGTIRLTAEGEDHLLGVGNAMRFRADGEHAYRNPGDEVAVFDMIIAYPRTG